jgi:hypothetical protein
MDIVITIVASSAGMNLISDGEENRGEMSEGPGVS